MRRLLRFSNFPLMLSLQGDRAEVHLADKLDEETAYNLIVVTTPAHQVDAVLPALQRSKAQWVRRESSPRDQADEEERDFDSKRLCVF